MRDIGITSCGERKEWQTSKAKAAGKLTTKSLASVWLFVYPALHPAREKMT